MYRSVSARLCVRPKRIRADSSACDVAPTSSPGSLRRTRAARSPRPTTRRWLVLGSWSPSDFRDGSSQRACRSARRVFEERQVADISRLERRAGHVQSGAFEDRWCDRRDHRDGGRSTIGDSRATHRGRRFADRRRGRVTRHPAALASGHVRRPRPTPARDAGASLRFSGRLSCQPRWDVAGAARRSDGARPGHTTPLPEVHGRGAELPARAATAARVRS